MNKKIILTSLVLSTLLFLGIGCVHQKTKTISTIPITKVKEKVLKKNKLPDFIQRRIISFDNKRQTTMLFIKVDQAKWQWFSQNNPQHPLSLIEWQKKLQSPLVINGFYFDENNQPTGFYQVEKGPPSKTKWPSLEKQKKATSYTGLVTINAKYGMRLKYLPYSPQKEPPQESSNFLSFPTLVAGGFSLIKTDSKKYARRTALAMDRDDNIYIIITELGTLSLYELAKWIEQQPEKIDIAVNLDGGKSTGLIYKDKDTLLKTPAIKLPNVLYLKPKE